MGGNKPVSQEIVRLVFQLRYDGWNRREIGMISPTGGVCLVRVNGNLNALGYEEILFDHLVPFLEEHGRSSFIYQQDNVPIHTAKRMKGFFDREGIEVSGCPAKSPDLNPIEKLWGGMKRWIQRKHPKNLQELHELVNEAFTALYDEEYCKKLYASMLKDLKG